MPGELKKLTIQSYTKVTFEEGSLVGEFRVMFNPETFTQKYDIEYEGQQGQGTTGTNQKYVKTKPQEYTFDFLFDGTGATAPKPEGGVANLIQKFLAHTADLDGEIHRPRFLKLSWGHLLSKCVLKSASINYTLFEPDGAPLRAKVSATFSESIDEQLRVAEEGKQSPDLTHVRLLRQGDTLPLLCHRIYEDAERYANVARHNQLDNFRQIAAGTQLKLPPLSILLAEGDENG